MQNINSVMKEAEVNLAEKARALQRVMDELCVKGANNTFAIGSSHIAVHNVCESNDLPSAMAPEQTRINSIYESNSSSKTADRIIEQLDSKQATLFQTAESNGYVTHRKIEEVQRPDHEEQQILMGARGHMNESEGGPEINELETVHEETPSCTKKSGFLGKQSRPRGDSNSQSSANRKRGTVHKFFRKFTTCFRRRINLVNGR